MPQFVIEREVPGAGSLTEVQIRDLSLRSLQTLKEMGPQIQWLHSYDRRANRVVTIRHRGQSLLCLPRAR